MWPGARTCPREALDPVEEFSVASPFTAPVVPHEPASPDRRQVAPLVIMVRGGSGQGLPASSNALSRYSMCGFSMAWAMSSIRDWTPWFVTWVAAPRTVTAAVTSAMASRPQPPTR